jgi:hypothetical protein
MTGNVCPTKLGAVKARAHPPQIRAGKFSCRLDRLKHALRFGERIAAIDSHDPKLLVHVCVEQVRGVDTP